MDLSFGRLMSFDEIFQSGLEIWTPARGETKLCSSFELRDWISFAW